MAPGPSSIMRVNLKPSPLIKPPSFSFDCSMPLSPSPSPWPLQAHSNIGFVPLPGRKTSDICWNTPELPGLWMELPVVSDVNLSAFKSNPTLSAANGKAGPGRFEESGFCQCYGDGNSLTSRVSEVLTGYETLDAPPRYDFYANTEVWGRRRPLRPSLFQLHGSPEVRNRVNIHISRESSCGDSGLLHLKHDLIIFCLFTWGP